MQPDGRALRHQRQVLFGIVARARASTKKFEFPDVCASAQKLPVEKNPQAPISHVLNTKNLFTD